MPLTQYEKVLLEGWEDTQKKSQLTLWILLSLKDGPKHMGDIKEFITAATAHTLIADDKSMYRALRRFNDAELIHFVLQKSELGPDKKVFSLTGIGKNVLDAFLENNIVAVFMTSKNKDLIFKR